MATLEKNIEKKQNELDGKVSQYEEQRDKFKSRHAKNIKRGPSSAAFWSDRVKWSEKKGE